MPTLEEAKDAWYDSLELHMEAVKAMGEDEEPFSKEKAFLTTQSATQSAAQAVLITQGDRQIELLEEILAKLKKVRA